MTAKAQAWANKDTGLQRMALNAQRIQRTAEKTANTIARGTDPLRKLCAAIWPFPQAG